MEVKKEWVEWLMSGQTGISSETMFSAITGIPINRYGTPADISDVGRCVRMLRALPELRQQLGKVTEKHKEWMPFIDCWKELERLYDECVAFEKTPVDERNKMKRRKYFTSPNDRAWRLMLELTCASRYLQGLRMQNTSSYWRNEPPTDF